jgi:hypothetical protein
MGKMTWKSFITPHPDLLHRQFLLYKRVTFHIRAC